MGKVLSSVSFSFLPSSPSFQMIGESTAAKPDLQLAEEITLLPHIHHSQQVEQEEEKKESGIRLAGAQILQGPHFAPLSLTQN